MDHEVRVATDEEVPDVLRAVESVFGEEVSDDEVARYRASVDLGRTIFIKDGDDIVAGGAAYTFRTTVPGNVLPTAGVTLIGVQPTHRRRGLLTAMMRHQMDDARERGEPIATLWASEGAIYGRFGYGLASVQAWVEIETEKGVFVDDPGPLGQTRKVPLDSALEVVAPVYDRVREATPGMFERSDVWWEKRLLADPKEWRDGASPKYCAVWEEDGKARAYVIYRLQGDWSAAGPIGNSQVQELIAEDTVALREMWRFVFGIDLTERVKSRYGMLPVDTPLMLMLAEPRRMRASLTDALWLRIVDLKAALEARSYAADGEIVFGLEDRFCEWNHGTWSLNVSGGKGTLEKSDGTPGLSFNASTLGTAYLGTYTFRQMARAGKVAASDEALSRADALFRTDVTPYCPEIF